MRMLKQALKNVSNKSDFGIVLDWNFHCRNGWVSAYTPFLVNEILARHNPVIISSQWQYNLHKKDLRYILSFEPGFAAPRIRYDGRVDCIKCVAYSDPHYQPERRRRYFTDNGFDYVLSFYRTPFFKHFKDFPAEKFVHFPWAVPDRFISDAEPGVRSAEVAIFGGKNSAAYDVRNWCREQRCVTNYDLSGVENKKLSDEEYYLWLRGFDAVVAAGSSSPVYNLVTPKYFEIASAGALLVGQSCEDLDALGFNDANALIFSKDDFVDKVHHYKGHREAYLAVRRNGVALVQHRHKLSDRIATIERLFGWNSRGDERSPRTPR